MKTVNCPKCGADVSDSYEPDDPSVGIVGGWSCECGEGIAEHEVGYDYHESDVGVPPAPRPAKLGTPLSELSTRPGEKGYDEFVRIAKSWGYD